MDLYLIELATYWGTAVVGALATAYTVMTSKDKDLRRSAVFNLLSFLVATTILHLVIKKVSPSYSFVSQLQDQWIPFKGINILLYFLFTDYLFYLYHRLTHRVPILWMGHYAHHSGNRLHRSLIIRDSVLGHIFVLPIGLLGIPLGLSPYGILIFVRIIIFYQSFLHFETNKDIPILKYIFVTPYNHIIHHSRIFEEAGHNYGGILCLWDRMCGTYREGDRYLTHVGIPGLKDPDSIWKMNVQPPYELFKKCWRARSVKPLFFFKGLPLLYKSGWPSMAAYMVGLVLLYDVIYRSLMRL